MEGGSNAMGDSTRLMASVVPLMYGIVAEVVTLGGCEREVNRARVGSGGE